MPDTNLFEQELWQQYPLPSAAATARARAAVMEVATERSRPARTANARRRWRPLLVAAVAIVALAIAGVAIADRLGAFNGGPFNGLSAAHHPRTPADVIDPATRAWLKNCGGNPCSPLLAEKRLGASRRIGQLPSGQNIYVFTTTWKALCYVVGPPSPEYTPEYSCNLPRSRSHPSTAYLYYNSPKSDWFTFGLALDGVTAVSFKANGRQFTVPVRNNVWSFRSNSFTALNAPLHSLTAHFADGTTVNEPCPICLSPRTLRRRGAPALNAKPLVVRGTQAHVAGEIGTPARPCRITVYKRSPYVRMRPRRIDRWGLGLYPKRPSDGRIAWTWIVGPNTTPGKWWIHVTCGPTHSFQTSFEVRR